MKFLRLTVVPALILLSALFVGCIDDPSCTDGIQNGLERGIDCDGPCLIPCPGTPPPGIASGSGTGLDLGIGTGFDLGLGTGFDLGDGTDSDSDSGEATTDGGSDSDDGSDSDSGGSANSFTADINGEVFSFQGQASDSDGSIMMQATNDNYSMTFNFSSGINFEEGQYTLTADSSGDVSLVIQQGLEACVEGEGFLNITEITNSFIAGTFSFTCGSGLDISIANGSFAQNY